LNDGTVTKILYTGEGDHQSTKGLAVIAKVTHFVLFLKNNQAHSWLTIAHAVPSPSPCVENSLMGHCRWWKYKVNLRTERGGLPKVNNLHGRVLR
jgi:hypothetical protein